MSGSVIVHEETSSASGLARSASREWQQRAVPIAYAASALIVFASIVLQFLTAGTAMFAPQAGASWDERWYAHVTYGTAGILIGSILLIALSFAARQSWRWTTVAVSVLVLFVVQSVLIQLYDTGDPVLRLIASLHVATGGLMLSLGVALAARGVKVARSGAG